VDAFSYLSVLLSIILGLAIAQVLQGAGQLLQTRGRVRWYWPAALWMASLLVMYVQSWWAMFGLRNVAAWTFGAFAVVLAQTVFEYLLAALLTPVSFGEGDVDLRAHWFAQARAFYVTLSLALVASMAKDLVLSHALPHGANLAFHLFLIALCGLGFAVLRDWAQRFTALVGAAVFLVYIALLFNRLQ